MLTKNLNNMEILTDSNKRMCIWNKNKKKTIKLKRKREFSQCKLYKWNRGQCEIHSNDFWFVWLELLSKL